MRLSELNCVDIFTQEPSESIEDWTGGKVNDFTREIIAINSLYDEYWPMDLLNKKYAADMKQGAIFPLILVSEDENGARKCEDGNHRLVAYQLAFPRATHIPAAVYLKP